MCVPSAPGTPGWPTSPSPATYPSTSSQHWSVYSAAHPLQFSEYSPISPNDLSAASHFVVCLCCLQFSSTSVSSLGLTVSGLVSVPPPHHQPTIQLDPPPPVFLYQLGGLLVRFMGVSLPCSPGWASASLEKVLARDPPPRLFSGASLSVQAQQRTDEIEQLMAAMYNRQVRMPAVLIK